MPTSNYLVNKLHTLRAPDPTGKQVKEEAQIVVTQYIYHKLNSASFEYHSDGIHRIYSKEAQLKLIKMFEADFNAISEEEKSELKHLVDISRFFDLLYKHKFEEYGIGKVSLGQEKDEVKESEQNHIDEQAVRTITPEDYLYKDPVLARIYGQTQKFDDIAQEVKSSSNTSDSKIFSNDMPKDLIVKILEFTDFAETSKEILLQHTMFGKQWSNIISGSNWLRILKRDFNYEPLSGNVEHSASLSGIYLRLSLLEKRNPNKFKEIYYRYLIPSNRELYPPLECLSLPENVSASELSIHFEGAVELGNKTLVNWIVKKAKERDSYSELFKQKRGGFRSQTHAFHVAVGSGSLRLVKLALEEWVYPNMRMIDAAWLNAVSTGNVQLVKWLHDTYYRIKFFDGITTDSVNTAFRCGHVTLVSELERISVREKKKIENYIEYQSVIESGNKQLIERFVLNKTVPSDLSQSKYEFNCCCSALISKKMQIVELFDSYFAEARRRNNENEQKRFIELAIASGNLSIVQKILPDNFPLATAIQYLDNMCKKGNLMLVRWFFKDFHLDLESSELLKKNAVNIEKAFETALETSNFELVKWFVETFWDNKIPKVMLDANTLSRVDHKIVEWLLIQRKDLHKNLQEFSWLYKESYPNLYRTVDRLSAVISEENLEMKSHAFKP